MTMISHQPCQIWLTITVTGGNQSPMVMVMLKTIQDWLRPTFSGRYEINHSCHWVDHICGGKEGGGVAGCDADMAHPGGSAGIGW